MNKFISTIICVTLNKILLFPSYKSTDFEVHRNWLSITYNLPVSKWYFDETSQWTVDYPPFFIYFECFLSYFGKFFDERMLTLSSVPYSSLNTIYFQRSTVLITDFVFYYACYLWFLELKKQKLLQNFFPNDEFYSIDLSIPTIFLWLPSLILIDHIHFQYNGFLNGFLLLSILKVCQKKFYQSAIYFCILLNFKHTYLCIAPIYLIFFLRSHCLTNNYRIQYKNFLYLTLIVVSIFTISFGQFIYYGQLKQLVNRLFPFKRGLTHSYWAPNFWAIYNTIDLVLNYIKKDKSLTSSTTKGLVQETEHKVLPSITPIITLVIVILFLIPCLVKLWRNCHKKSYQEKYIFLRSLIICAYSTFLFGWHVHEKAILTVLIPMIPLAFLDENDGKLFLILNTVATYSLFPLIYEKGETLSKILLLLTYSIYLFTTLNRIHKHQKSIYSLNIFEIIYLCFTFCIQFYITFGYLLMPYLHEKYNFLPLLITSIYCSIGIFYTYFKAYYNLLIL